MRPRGPSFRNRPVIAPEEGHATGRSSRSPGGFRTHDLPRHQRYGFEGRETITIDQAALRHAIRDQRKIRFTYQDLDGRSTERVARPLIMAFYGPVWLLAAWCELRGGFRVFRIDRMSAFSALETKFDQEPGKTAEAFLKQDAEKKQTAPQQSQPSGSDACGSLSRPRQRPRFGL
jgi:WYL domain